MNFAQVLIILIRLIVTRLFVFYSELVTGNYLNYYGYASRWINDDTSYAIEHNRNDKVSTFAYLA